MIRNYLKLTVLIAFVAGIVSCNKGIDDSVDEQKILENENAIKKYIADSSFSAVRDSSGLYYSLSPNPTGVKPSLGDEVKVRYNAYLLNGTKVWTSEKDTSKFIKYPFFTNDQFVLPGIELALRLMRTGEKAKVFVPFYLGFYGKYEKPLTGYFTNPNIPEYSPIRIDLELVSKSSELEQINSYITQNKLTVSERTTDNLVLVKTTTVATGDTLGSDKSVKIKYTGKLLDGTVFDPGATPLAFITGAGRNNLIPGFDRGIRRLKTGEKAILIIPSKLGYSTSGQVNKEGTNFIIRPYQPIMFNVEVLPN